jgi:hypothetical protein
MNSAKVTTKAMILGVTQALLQLILPYACSFFWSDWPITLLSELLYQNSCFLLGAVQTVFHVHSTEAWVKTRYVTLSRHLNPITPFRNESRRKTCSFLCIRTERWKPPIHRVCVGRPSVRTHSLSFNALRYHKTDPPSATQRSCITNESFWNFSNALR